MSRADNEEAFVTELDGQPRAYMEISDEHSTVRLVYRCMVFNGDTEDQVRQAIEDCQVALHVELKKAWGDSIIFWRRRPEVQEEEGNWQSSMRFATSPPLSEEAWHNIGWRTPAPYDENCTHVTLAPESDDDAE